MWIVEQKQERTSFPHTEPSFDSYMEIHEGMQSFCVRCIAYLTF